MDMQESKRQKQVAALIQEEMTNIFQRLGFNAMDGGLVSISSVKITPDLLESRIYLSLFQVQDQNQTLKKIEQRSWEFKKELALRVKNQLRRIPEIQFFIDDTLDHVFKMEELFKQIKEQDSENKKDDTKN
jgi:ribosome-binding factor A